MIFKKKGESVLAWWHGNNGTFNFGDELNPYLIQKISGKNVKRVIQIPKFAFSKINICIGSVIVAARPSCNVWGAGIIEKSSRIFKSNYFAVRGKHTQKRMTSLGIKPPTVIGDPALLLPLYYNPKIDKSSKFGITPHIVDYHSIHKNFGNRDVRVIDFTKPNIETIIDEMLECEVIISSSLHGLIVANAYNIPAIWVKFSNKLYGDDIKFYDYFSSVGWDENISPYRIDPDNFDLNRLVEISKTGLIHPKESMVDQVQKNLLDVCPFK